MNSQIHAEVLLLKFYLQRYPEKAAQLAINHLEDYLILLNEYKNLQDQIELLQQFKSPLISRPDSQVLLN